VVESSFVTSVPNEERSDIVSSCDTLLLTLCGLYHSDAS